MNVELARRRAANRADVKLPSGLAVTLRLPDLADCLAAGDIPHPVLLRMEASARTNGNGNGKGKAPEVSAEDMRFGLRYQRELIRASVIGLEGEPLDEPLTDEDIVDVFTDAEDRAEVVAYAQRDKPLPLPA